MTTVSSSPQSPLRIGTRGSDLALWQANYVRSQLCQAFGQSLRVEIEVISTQGDRVQDRALHEVGGKGLFVKEIEQRLLDGEVDIAVHSMKDMPARAPDGLIVAATPAREDPRDALVGPKGVPLHALPPGTRVGTGSLRRSALVRRLNPGVEVVALRGNVPTRLKKVEDGELDAVLVAAAGLRRLERHDRVSEFLDTERFCPAPAQGVLALQCRIDDTRTRTLLEALDDEATGICARAERAFLRRLGADCTTPVGCYAQRGADNMLSIAGLVIDPSGDPCFVANKSEHAGRAEAAGQQLAEELLALGADCVPGVGELDVA